MTETTSVTGAFTRGEGKAGYLDDAGITNKQSCTETFAAAVLHVNNPRWDGVPFVLKAGKAVNQSKVELRVQFHPVPGVVSDLEQCVANELVETLPLTFAEGRRCRPSSRTRESHSSGFKGQGRWVPRSVY